MLNRFLRHLFLFFIPLIFFACAGESTEPQPGETSYQLFPNGYFSTGFREEYTMTGTSTNGETHTGTLLILTQAQGTFAGQPVISIRTQTDWEDASTGATYSSITDEKYTLDNANRQRLGVENPLTTQTFSATAADTLPLNAKIGDSGSIGTFVDQFGNVETVTWQLEEESENRAVLTIATTLKDVNGAAISEGDFRYVIAPNGTHESLTLRFFLAFNGITTNWTGNKQ